VAELVEERAVFADADKERRAGPLAGATPERLGEAPAADV
jgi:hypothetical protein